MRERERRVARTVEQGGTFVRSRADGLPEIATLARRLLRHAERVTALSSQEYSATRNASRGEAALIARRKADLRETHLKRIAKAGRKLMRNVPGVARALAVPAKSAPADSLVASARAMVKAVRPARKLFVEAGFAPDFDKACANAANALAHAARESGSSAARTARVRRDLADAIRDGRATIEVIDAVLQPRFALDSGLAIEWRSATRVGRRAGRPPRRRARVQPPPPTDPS